MDKDTLRKAIVDMFQELRDSAISGIEGRVRYLKWSAKPKGLDEYSFKFSPLVVDYEVKGGLPGDKWDDSTLEKLHRGLTDRRVNAEALGEDKLPIRQSSVTPSTKLPRVHHILRDRLLCTIEEATGRPVISASGKIPDPRRSDPKPPNSYEWAFSDEYRSFPKTKGGLARWPIEDIRRCHEALDNGYLSAVDVAARVTKSPQPAIWQSRIPSYFNDERQDDQSEQDEEDESEGRFQRDDPPCSESSFGGDDDLPVPPNNTAESSDSVPVDQDFQNTCNAFKQELETIDSESTNSHIYNTCMKDFFARMFEDILHLVIKKRTEELKGDWKSRLASQKQKSHIQIETLQSSLEAKVQELEAAQDEAAVVESEKQALALQVAEGQEQIQTKLDKARIEGEQEGRRRAIEDCNASMESDLSALRRSHLEQINNVRAESYKEGFDAGRRVVSPPAAEKTHEGSVDIEALKSFHEEERLLALDHGRRQGREMAYQELALTPGDQFNMLTQHNNELNKTRKIREFKTIHQHWQDIPQRALPPYMLPEGHTLCDKTLYLLAELSKEVDKSEAIPLLTQEIKRRCQDLDPEPANYILADADIQNVLNSLATSATRDATTPPESPRPTATPMANISIKKLRPLSEKVTRSSACESPAEPPKATPETPPSSSNPKAAAAVQGNFTTALQAWLDLSNIDPELATKSTITKTILELSAGKDRKLRAMVMERSKAAGIMGKEYVTSAEVKTLKRYLAGLTLELSSSFPLPDISTCDDVVEVFKAIHAIFLHESNSPAQEQQGISQVLEDSSPIIPSSQTIIPSTQLPKPTLKRKRNDDLPTQKPKRQKPKTEHSLPWQDIDISKLFEESFRGSNSVDVNDGTIVIDDGSSPDIKTDEDQVEEDLYDATPPLPKGRKRPPRSSACF